MDAKRRRTHAKLAELPGVRSIRRPVTPGSSERFDLHYVRSGPPSSHPLVVIPGGPGGASVAPYQGLRRRLAKIGVNVIMVEHRGVGLSRHDDSGADLPTEALTIAQVVDDVAAVLDDAGVETAAVYGTSYGTYLAAGLGARHPSRVSAMALDSPLLSRHDFDVVRRVFRELFWYHPGELAQKVRALTDAGALEPEDLTIVAAVYGIAGPEALGRHLDALLDRRRLLWTAMRRLYLTAARRKVPFHTETDLVGPMGFRELNFAGSPDGQPLDTTLTWRGVPGADTPFEGEPFDLAAEMREFHWPTVVISGGRDLITPPAVADRIVGLLPAPTWVRLPTAAHSMLDTRQDAALRIISEVAGGRAGALSSQGEALDGLPAVAPVRVMAAGLSALPRLSAVLPRFGAHPPTS